jgi:hypothetical protein
LWDAILEELDKDPYTRQARRRFTEHKTFGALAVSLLAIGGIAAAQSLPGDGPTKLLNDWLKDAQSIRVLKRPITESLTGKVDFLLRVPGEEERRDVLEWVGLKAEIEKRWTENATLTVGVRVGAGEDTKFELALHLRL